MSRYGWTRLWARLMTLIGVVLVCLGVVLAGVALVIETPWGSLTGQVVLERVVAALVLIVSGVLAGGPFIVLGQLLSVLLDQRRLLARIRRRLERWDRRFPEPPQPPTTGSRLLPRR